MEQGREKREEREGPKLTRFSRVVVGQFVAAQSDEFNSSSPSLHCSVRDLYSCLKLSNILIQQSSYLAYAARFYNGVQNYCVCTIVT